jgi:hypothetical protein
MSIEQVGRYTRRTIGKMAEYIETPDRSVKVVKVKDVFDKIGLKKDRRPTYPMLQEIIKEKLPDARMIRF